MNYSTGDHVVCVDGKFEPGIAKLYTALPVEGQSYVVRDIRLGIEPDCRTGTVSVLLVGLVNPPANSRAALERGFKPERFRPLDQTTTREDQPQAAPLRRAQPVTVVQPETVDK